MNIDIIVLTVIALILGEDAARSQNLEALPARGIDASSVRETSAAYSNQSGAKAQPPLDSQCAAFLKGIADQGLPGWEAMSPVESRKVFSSLDQLFGTGPSEVLVEDKVMEAGFPLRIYRQSTTNAPKMLPVVMYFHGGGWVLGDIQTHDALCRRLCYFAKCAVVSVGYRLAPEHPFPIPFDDCYSATKYIESHAKELGMDSSRLVVAGDSAGGTLAAAVALRSRNSMGPRIQAQVLIYPALNPECDSSSYRDFGEGFGLSKASMQWFWKQYLGGGREVNSYAAPSTASSLAGLPRTILVTAQYDILRAESEEFAAKLRAAGVTVDHQHYDGMIHGFVHFAGAFDKGQQATLEIANSLRELFRKTN
jgi:acetyl esterase